MKLIYSLVGLLFSQSVTQVAPPVWPDHFSQAFDETFVMPDKSEDIVNGVLYYDAGNNRSRYDRHDGQFDMFCSSLAPHVATYCINLVVDGKRYIVFPNKSQCCECCDSAHGCGILKPNWLEGAEYKGIDTIHGDTFHKWDKEGDVGYNYYWATTDGSATPRRIDEGGHHIIDFNVFSYRNQTIDPKVFEVPSYCKSECPLTSFCGKFRTEKGGEKLVKE